MSFNFKLILRKMMKIYLKDKTQSLVFKTHSALSFRQTNLVKGQGIYDSTFFTQCQSKNIIYCQTCFDE